MATEQPFAERRSCVRHKVHGPLFASFDGVTGGMILDLSEQGLAMQTAVPLQNQEQLHMRLDFPANGASDFDALEMTGYVAWVDALGRAGVRFSDLPPRARQRLDDWLAHHDEAPSRRAPKLTFDRSPWPSATYERTVAPPSISLEADAAAEGLADPPPVSNTVQYEFHSLGPDLNAALRVISERAQKLLRGTGAAIALLDPGALLTRSALSRSLWPEGSASKGMLCRASVGTGGPPLGTPIDMRSGFSGECVRTAKALRCDDTETDSRVAVDICRHLGIRSMVAAPIRYECEVIGLVEVFSANTFAFDEGDLAILERLAQTAVIASQGQLVRQR